MNEQMPNMCVCMYIYIYIYIYIERADLVSHRLGSSTPPWVGRVRRVSFTRFCEGPASWWLAQCKALSKLSARGAGSFKSLGKRDILEELVDGA